MAIDVSSAGGALLITILRALHIIFGLVWVGAALLMTVYIEPTAERAGADGKRVLRALYAGTNLSRLVPAAAIITTVAGLLLYEMLSYSAAMSTASGLTITIGAAFGLLAFLHGLFAVWRPAIQLSSQLKAGETGESTLTSLEDKIRRNGRVSLWLALTSLVLMAGARYIGPVLG